MHSKLGNQGSRRLSKGIVVFGIIAFVLISSGAVFWHFYHPGKYTSVAQIVVEEKLLLQQALADIAAKNTQVSLDHWNTLQKTWTADLASIPAKAQLAGQQQIDTLKIQWLTDTKTNQLDLQKTRKGIAALRTELKNAQQIRYTSKDDQERDIKTLRDLLNKAKKDQLMGVQIIKDMSSYLSDTVQKARIGVSKAGNDSSLLAQAQIRLDAALSQQQTLIDSRASMRAYGIQIVQIAQDALDKALRSR
jgi:hypothetical protein